MGFLGVRRGLYSRYRGVVRKGGRETRLLIGSRQENGVGEGGVVVKGVMGRRRRKMTAEGASRETWIGTDVEIQPASQTHRQVKTSLTASPREDGGCPIAQEFGGPPSGMARAAEQGETAMVGARLLGCQWWW